MIINANDTSGSWNGNYYYDFMFPTNEDAEDPLDLVIELREIIEERPKTTAGIKLKMFMDASKRRYITKDMIYLVGSWIHPHNREQGFLRIVNPNCPDVPKYSDILTWCECGQALLQTTRSKRCNRDINEHDDSCPIYQRQLTNSKINKKRASLLRTMLRLNYPATSVLDRFGLERDNMEAAWAKRMGVDMHAEKAHGMRLISNTMALLAFDHSTKKIGKAFDCSYAEVSRKIKENTGVDPREAYRQRRWG